MLIVTPDRVERFLGRFRVKCKDCPWDRGLQYEYDCGAPDCMPYIWSVWISKIWFYAWAYPWLFLLKCRTRYEVWRLNRLYRGTK